ncbi:bacteriocin immunity protein [Mixta theicola]|uniref:Bacteriocin immunity protein n=1 Tax=Mixta theicola TaxID=1458355 RepID=A0A2K1Q6R0_9GAMM|nr:bacteriocin immunity protein [Mixta theicola]PNS10744.1 bacteriocin immunity protein [Mixta theicola]GLR08890.1 colicin immunity protein E2 [Mixta theicola]
MERISLQDFTEQEFINFAHKILLAEFETTEGLMKAVTEFVLLSGHPAGTDLILYPQDFNITTPQSMVDVIKSWRGQHGLPCFRDDYHAIAL